METFEKLLDEWGDNPANDKLKAALTAHVEGLREEVEKGRYAQHENATLRQEIEKLREEVERLKAERDEAAKSAEQSAASYQDLGATMFAQVEKLERENAELRGKVRA